MEYSDDYRAETLVKLVGEETLEISVDFGNGEWRLQYSDD